VDRDLKVIMIISCVKGEGKSTVAANLANSIAETSQKVLILDADLRDPSIHRIFYLPNRRGLSDMICSKFDEKSMEELGFIDHYSTYLDVLTAGHKPPNPTELLGSMRMMRILTHLRNLYEYIIIDTPPFFFTSDALALSKYVDGTLLISRYGYTTKEILKNAKEKLKLANIQPLACILNDVDNIHKKFYYGYSDYSPQPPAVETEADSEITMTRRQARRAKA
jgi:capsular exopolysaccharide synthesis family protein